jgi:CHAT domain-containing protein
MFMTAAPRGEAVLNFEAEENAILDATGTLGLDLVVEESGNPDRLAERLAEVGSMQVLHLSCHGRSQPTPALVLETDEGDRLPTPAAALIETLQNHLPRLLFVSACESSATPETLEDPLALTLVRAGVPAVLGWDGSVYDHEATAFASALYESLSRRGRLEEAVGAARRALLNAPGPQRSRDCHRARLWLGRSGGGVLVGGRRRRLAADHGYKEFLDKRRQQSVAGSQSGGVCRAAT